MKKTVIIEDEVIAAQTLRNLLTELEPDMKVLATLQSVEESVDWFHQHDEPDMVFMDIHLADGSSFHIFDSVTLKCPIIFTTAYDEYALQAFHVNSIDYLLKPIKKEDLRHALDKYERLTASNAPLIASESIAAILADLQQKEKTYRSYFLIPHQDKLLPLAVSDIACFYVENKTTEIITYRNQKYTLDTPLDQIMQQLNPTIFFRANRQFIVAHKAISDINFWFGNKLKLQLSVSVPEIIIISKAKVSEFKTWYTK